MSARATLHSAVAASPRRRIWSLLLLSARSVRAGGLSRAGRTYAWVIALANAGLLLLLASRGDWAQGLSLVPRALGWISCAGGVVAWAAARSPDAEGAGTGFVSLAESRGLSHRVQDNAHAVAAMGVVARAVALPALALTVLGLVLAPTFHDAIGAAPLAVGVIGYALAFGAALGALARGAALLSPRRGSVVFAAAVLGPLAARPFFGPVPGVVSGFSWLLDQVARLAGAS